MAVATREKRGRDDPTLEAWLTGDSLADPSLVLRFSSPDCLETTASSTVGCSPIFDGSVERVKGHSPTPLSTLSNVLRCALNTSNICALTVPEVPSGASVTKRWRFEAVCKQGATVLAKDLMTLVSPAVGECRDEYMSKCSRTVLSCCEHIRQSLRKEDVVAAHTQLEALTNTISELMTTPQFRINLLDIPTLKSFAFAWTAFLRAAKLSRKISLGEVQSTRHQLELIHFALSRHDIDILNPVLTYLRKLLASL
eukprot:m.43437 g.43437  ORF g.43437 m.43437 type:complete len:254 (-) comp10775_c0_seq2:284-1045(-)